MAEVWVPGAEALCEGQSMIFEANGLALGIYFYQGRYFAYRNLCPHQGGPACEGVILPKVEVELNDDRTFCRNAFSTCEMHIVCPWHGWEFNILTGRAAADPAFGLKGYPVVERGDRIYVDL